MTDVANTPPMPTQQTEVKPQVNDAAPPQYAAEPVTESPIGKMGHAPEPAAQPAVPASLASAPRRIEYVPLDSLKADPRNPKSHNLEMIDSSYTRFGVVDAATVDGRTGYIISGHGRTLTLREMFSKGEAAPEGVQVAEDGSWLVPVNLGWSSKNDSEAAAALIAMNRLTEMGGWVDESLLSLLQEIGESGEGFAGVGYDESDMDDLKAYLASEGEALGFDPETADDDVDGGIGDAGKIDLTEGQVVVNVILNEVDRPRLYALLQTQDYVIDMRNSRGQ